MAGGSGAGVAGLMEEMAAAGAPLEAILIAVRALEAQGRAERERKHRDARRKAEKRAEAKAAESPRRVGGRGAEKAPPVRGAEARPRTAMEGGPLRPGTSAGQAPDAAPQKEIPPDPHKKNSPPFPKAKALVPRRLAQDFEMPADWKDWARQERGWAPAEIESEAANFIDYWLARGAGSAKRDWRRTWHNWVRNARRPDGPHRNARPASREELRDAQLRAAALYERMGRSDEAAEIRRLWGGEGILENRKEQG